MFPQSITTIEDFARAATLRHFLSFAMEIEQPPRRRVD